MQKDRRLPPSDMALVDDVIAQVIALYKDTFPSRPISFYLTGSYADGTANDLSDIDLIAATVGWTPDDRDLAQERAIFSLLPTSPRVDVALIAERNLPASHVSVNVKLSSRHISGEDIRHRLDLPSLDQYRRHVAEGANHFIFKVLRDPNTLSFPLQYPDPDDEFFGYARKRIAAWYPPSTQQGLKELVTSATRIATALLALQVGCYVGSKSQSIHLYRNLIADRWTDYLDLLYSRGKVEWRYRLPDNPADRILLRHLCAEFLDFERHFLALAPPEAISSPI